MADCQIESFVQKFHEHEHDLDFDCHAGEAWIGFRLRLGYHRAGDAQPRDQRAHRSESVRRRGPSYSRRFERRAAHRNRVEAEHAHDQVEVAAHAPNHTEHVLKNLPTLYKQM